MDLRQVEFDERTRIIALSADIGVALTTNLGLSDMLHDCTRAMVNRLDAAFARIWTVDDATQTLVLRASSGLYTHLDGPHSRVAIGEFKIGLIAQERSPHLTNSVVTDPRVSDPEWAIREGMVSFAGYPLIVNDRLVGVAAMFAREPLSELTLEALSAVSNQIALGIERERAERERFLSEERYRHAFANAAVGIVMLDPSGTFVSANDAFCRMTGYSEQELFALDIAALVDRADLARHNSLISGRSSTFGIDARFRHKSGATIWVRNSASLSGNSGHFSANVALFCEDVTEQRMAEAERDRALESLRASEAVFRQMADTIPHIAWTTDGDGNVEYYNQRWYEYSQLNFEETRDWGWQSAVHPDDLNRAVRAWSTSIADGVACEVEYRLKRADGKYVWHIGRSEPIKDLHGSVVRWVGTATDISARIETERTQRLLLDHERTIAEQLQTALQPDLPARVSGLKLRKYYEAALTEEAGVGGDFYDVFTIREDCTALVVGDLSGKGLAAATQVSTVRNMLRAFIYTSPTLAEAINSLNAVLALNSLLSGFSTLFVGTYDAETRMLTYVNCGQEPALLSRFRERSIEELSPTGPVLGALELARFAEASVQLGPGDALAMFTDGLTEVGPSRTNMLGIEGVSRLLMDSTSHQTDQQLADLVAEHVTLNLIAGVDSYSDGGIRDDVCLLVAVVENA